MQYPVRIQFGHRRLPRNRGKCTPEPFLGTGIQSDRLPAGFRGRKTGPGLHARRNRRDEHPELGLCSPATRLHDLQNPALGPKQVRRRIAPDRIEHEIGRRNHVDRQKFRGDHPERSAYGRAGDARFRLQQRHHLREPRRRTGQSDRCACSPLQLLLRKVTAYKNSTS